MVTESREMRLRRASHLRSGSEKRFLFRCWVQWSLARIYFCKVTRTHLITSDWPGQFVCWFLVETLHYMQWRSTLNLQ